MKKGIKFLMVIGCIFILNQTTMVQAMELPNTIFKTVDVENTRSLNKSSDAWGRGSIKATDPLGTKPQAYAITEVYSGSAYCVKAQIFCDDDNGDTYSSVQVNEKNVSYVESAKISSKTSGCKFRGEHWIQLISGGGWQSANTSKSY